MNAKILLMAASALIMLLLGVVHLVMTFATAKLFPRDAGLIESMKTVTLVVTNETTVWKAWTGFNASHSMAAIFFGLVFGYLAVAHPAVLFGSVFLQLAGFLLLSGFLVLCWLYWFSVPLTGISVALACYLASLAAARFDG